MNRSQKCFDIMGVMVLIIDTNRRISLVNQKGCEILGGSREEIIGKDWFETFLPPDVRQIVLEVYNKVISGQSELIGYFENHILTLAGEKRLIAWHNTIIRDEAGNITGCLSLGDDITERRQAEATMMALNDTLEQQVAERTAQLEATIAAMDDEIRRRRDAEQHMSLLNFAMNNVREAVFLVDEGLRFHYVNKEACRSLGYTEEELLRLSVADIDPDCSRSGKLVECWLELKAKGTITFETHHKAKDGTVFPVEINKTYLEYDGNGYTLCMARDISERKRMEDMLRHAQKMEAIGTLAGGVAHDFNNILGAIIGCAELSLLEVTVNSTVYRHLMQILTAGNRAARIVKQMMTFSRKTDQKRQLLQVSSLIKETLKTTQTFLPSNISVNQYIPDSGFILADPVQIHQAFTHLCANAANAMQEKGGILAVRLTNVCLDTGDDALEHDMMPGQYVMLSVSDTGVGMDRQTLDRIFDPYFSTHHPGNGAGLGLSVIYGIVKGHGGSIRARSASGAGSVFEIFLPVIEDIDNKIAEFKTVEPILTGNEHILLVDDNESLVAMEQQRLGHLGYQVTVALSGNEALDMFRSQPDAFDLVITDLSMHGMTGIELAEKCIEIRSDIPVILCTGFKELFDEESLRSKGIKRLMLKPFDIRKLANVVRSVLDKRAG